MTQMLSGLKVLDFSIGDAGSLAAAMMADYGAEVIKIETPGYGCPQRYMPPLIYDVSLWHCWTNRGKKSITIAIDTQKGYELVLKMIKDVDVVIESFSPGYMDSLGLGYSKITKLCPKLIYCAVTAFGQEGPYSNKNANDLIVQALSGVMAITGEIGGTPVKHGFALSDHVGAQSAFSAAMTAICNREITGDGQLVDISTMQALVWMNSSIDRVNADIYSSREGNHHLTLSPYGVFSGKNMQSIIICALNPKIWNSICNLIGKPELSGDPRFASVSKRASNRMLVVHEIEEWLNKFDNIQGAIDLFENAGVPCCRVLGVNEVLQDTHIRAAGWLREIEAPDSLKDKGVETYLGYAASVTFSETPAIIGKAADLGQHNHEIFGSYGISSHETDILNDKWKKSAFSARR